MVKGIGILTNYEKLKTRIIVAQSIGWNPDDVRVIDHDNELDRTLYVLDKFKDHNICLGFDHVPTIEEAREKIKHLYLCGIELDFDEEFGDKNEELI